MTTSATTDPIRIGYLHARRVGLSREDAEDCALDFRLHLLNVVTASVQNAAWLHRCARNYACNYLRGQIRRRERERRYSEQAGGGVVCAREPVMACAGPRTLTLRKALWEQVFATLQQFTPEQRDLFLQYHVRQRNLTEISAQTERSLAAVSQAIYHIHRRLSRLLMEQGWTAADAEQLCASALVPASPHPRA